MIKEKKLFNSNLRKLSVFLSIFLLPGIAVTQTAERATHIPVSEIMAAYQGLGRIPDQQVRVVDIGNNINVGVGILRRESTQTDEGEGITALSHRDITEVYYVLSGSGILETGGDGEGDREFPPASSLVRELVGPTDVRTVKNGETMTISAGDVVVIPAGVLHGFRKILDQITYLSIRIDPDQVLPAGYIHPNIK
jgi:Mannose-6-phosphate isomerase